MATKTSFTPEEPQLLMEGIMSSGVAITAADPSGLWGLLKEGMASLHLPGLRALEPLAQAVLETTAPSRCLDVSDDGLE